MDSWEWTKIGTAVTTAITVAIGANWFGGRMVAPAYPQRPAYAPQGMEEAPVDLAALQRSWPAGLVGPGDRSRLHGYMETVGSGRASPPLAAAIAAPSAIEPLPDLGTLLASADPERGASTARMCATCHTFDAGGADRTGPNLWGIVGRDIAARAGFSYSPAITAEPGSWTYQALDRYLASPARAIPGNKMAFAGIRRPADRANVLAWLASLAPRPAPFPPPSAS